MKSLKVAVVYNGIEGLDQLYVSNKDVTYQLLPVGQDFKPDLDAFDVLLIPNGSDHVALYHGKEQIAAFLEKGKVLLCFDGWFTNWLPHHTWVMDNSKKTIDVRYFKHSNALGILEGFDVSDLNYSNGISGWWACGYIEPSHQADVLITDTWQRPVLVADSCSTKGLIIASASAPLADFSYATTDDETANRAMSDLYRRIIHYVYFFTFKTHINA